MLTGSPVFAQNDSTLMYSFIIQDSPSVLFTMRQFNQNYISAYRLFTRELNDVAKDEHISDLVQLGLQALFLAPLTHEEGHRSVLTALNIGSVSQPYFNSQGTAYVKGVTDATLRDLRDNDLPAFIRLHEAGLESDYLIAWKLEETGSFGFDNFKNYRWEYWSRKASILQYYLLGIVGYEADYKEESNELDRDIVGFDTYGAVRHLFRPHMDYYRYTSYDQLTRDEKKFVHRMGYRSLLNLINPLMLGKNGFRLSDNSRLNAGMGYTMAPFGDFIEEDFYLATKKNFIGFYMRQYQNKTNWFNAFGASLVNFPVMSRLYADIYGHFWQQPAGLDFNTADHFNGGAIDLNLRYFFFTRKNIFLKGFSLDLGGIYKSRGFLPGELFLGEHAGLRFGTSVLL
jgi:hypothetical protein